MSGFDSGGGCLKTVLKYFFSSSRFSRFYELWIDVIPDFSESIFYPLLSSIGSISLSESFKLLGLYINLLAESNILPSNPNGSNFTEPTALVVFPSLSGGKLGYIGTVGMVGIFGNVVMDS